VNQPRHIAIIMDGNGRWAEQRNQPRTFGHRAGADRVREITTECARLGIEQLTLYAFSVENWRRPEAEINALMELLTQFLVRERSTVMDNNIRFRAIGRLDDLPDGPRHEIDHLTALSAQNTGTTLCLALSYGGRTEIANAARRIAEDAAAGRLRPDRIDEDAFAAYLYTAGMPDPDLLIRTANEMRVSNFLLWQISYTEIVVTNVLWPDFGADELHKAIAEFSRRERRFGAVAPPDAT
jgi:undecaprenyl diphosphate synthase